MIDITEFAIHTAQASRELENKGCNALTREQLECLADPARIDEALGMLDDLEARCGLSASTRGELAALVAGNDPEADDGPTLTLTGFAPLHTGGGCMALAMTLTDGTQVLVTDIGGAYLPRATDTLVLVGLYDANGQEVESAEMAPADVLAWTVTRTARTALLERDAARKEADVYGKAAESLGDSFRAMRDERDAARNAAESASEEHKRMGAKWAEASAERDALAKALRELIEHPAELFERGHESARLTFTPETIAAARAALAKVSK